MRILWTTNEPPSFLHAPLVFLNPLAAWLRGQGIDIELHRTGSLRSPWAIHRATREIGRKARSFDIVHAQYGSACAVATVRGARGPAMITVRGSDWNAYSASYHWLWAHTRVARELTRHAIPRASTVLAVSHRLVDELRRIAPGVPMHCVPTPIDLEKFRPADPHELARRSALGLPADPGRPWVLFNSLDLGNPVKRFRLAKESIELARSELGVQCELVLATGIPHEQIPALTRCCDVILSTSESEGWPNCIKEALASGVPFVATDTSDLRDIARIDPRCEVVDSHPRAIANAIARTISMRGTFDRDDLRRHVTSMQLPSIGSRMMEIYRSVIGRGTRCAG
jgi:glycosyltransferase involved in cell wall biosynthesis